MSKEYIKREAILTEEQEIYYWNGLNDVSGDFIPVEVIKNAPAADVAPVVHGEWIKTCYADYRCSICGRHEEHIEPYCHCGAKMDGGNTND